MCRLESGFAGRGAQRESGASRRGEGALERAGSTWRRRGAEQRVRRRALLGAVAPGFDALQAPPQATQPRALARYALPRK